MAWRGSGVRIPSAPPKNCRSEARLQLSSYPKDGSCRHIGRNLGDRVLPDADTILLPDRHREKATQLDPAFSKTRRSRSSLGRDLVLIPTERWVLGYTADDEGMVVDIFAGRVLGIPDDAVPRLRLGPVALLGTSGTPTSPSGRGQAGQGHRTAGGRCAEPGAAWRGPDRLVPVPGLASGRQD